MSFQEFCSRATARCEENRQGPHYRYSSFGQNTPLCCASHLVEILFFAADLFEQHDIPYFIVWGTHLGAIRHQGLIPWDTDVDMGVFTDDGDRVLQLLPTFEQAGYYVHHVPGSRLVTINYSRQNLLHLDLELWTKSDSSVSWDSHTIENSDLFPLRRYPFYDRELLGPQGQQYVLDYYGPDCFEVARKQWLYWGTSFWRKGVADKPALPLQDRSPAPVDLQRDFSDQPPAGSFGKRLQQSLIRAGNRLGTWHLRMAFKKLLQTFHS